ncbi:MAG: carboxypeptidase regulatory-like domain-containing protein [Terriglobales bacterium]
MNTVTSRKRFAVVLASLAIFTLMATPAFGQAISGTLTGTVYDPTGAAVNGATVTAVNTATGQTETTTTKALGDYRFENLPVGSYNITASSPNFKTTTLANVPVELNKIGTANFQLEVGSSATTVEVSGIAPPVDTTTAQIATNYQAAEVQDVPAAALSGGAGVLNLSLYSAGVASPGGVGSGMGPSVGGQRSRNNNFTIEGTDDNNKSVTGALAIVPNDAVESFTLLQNQFSPEFGHSSGGQFNTVVVGGTNSFHGRVYEYFQNRNLNAIDFAIARGVSPGQPVVNPRYDNNRFGGQIGGPLIKNKLFFFYNQEYNPIGQSSTPANSVYAPTANGMATIAAGSGVSATNLAIFKKYVPVAPACPPAPNNCITSDFAGNPVEANILPIVSPNYINNSARVATVDFNISDHDQLRGRYVYNKSALIDTAANLSAFWEPTPFIEHLFTVAEYHNFSPNVTNEFRVGYTRYYNITNTGNFKFPGLDSFPNILFTDLNLQIGPDPNGPQETIINTYQGTDNLTWTKGKNTLQFGAEYIDYISPQTFTQRSRGDYDYNSIGLYLQDQTPDNLAERSLGNPIYYGNQKAIYWYANDVLKVTPNLTLDLGVRYEYTGVTEGESLQSLNQAASVPGLVSFAKPVAPKDDFAPRIGFAYSPGTSGNTSIRGGFGEAYDVNFDNIGILSLPPQLSGTVDCAGGGPPPCPAPTALFLGSGGIPPTNGGIQTFPDIATQRAATANHVVVNQKYPYSLSWNLGIQHVFAKSYTAEIRYLGTRGVNLDTQERINRQDVVTPTNYLPTFLTPPTPAQIAALTLTLDGPGGLNAQNAAGASYVPAYAAAGFNAQNLVQFTPNGASTYHGLASSLNRRFDNGLQFQIAYTYSHNIDNSTADFFSTVLTPRRPQDFQNLAADRSNSALDRRHRFTALVLYDLPFFKTRGAILKNVVGNWELVPVYTYETGEWVDAQSGIDANLNGDAAGDRTVFNPNGVPGTGSDATAVKNTAGFTVGYVAKNPNAQYIEAYKGALATSARNTLASPPINNWDLALVKKVSFTERFKMEVAAQASNALNHPEFTTGFVNSVNQLSQTGNTPYLQPRNPAFNNPRLAFSSNPRTMQLSAKFIF